MCSDTCENPLVPGVFLGGDFLAGDFCSMEGECMSTFFFPPTQHNGSSLLTGICFEVTWQRGFLPMFIHCTFKYDTLMTIHRITSVLVSNFSASNGKFIPRAEVSLFENAGGFMHNRHILELIFLKY